MQVLQHRVDARCRNPLRYYRAEGIIRNFNTIDEFRQVDRAALVERAGKTIWEAINDGTIYSCPSLLTSFTAICFADLKKYKFTYHFAFPALHSDPQWGIATTTDNVESGISRLGSKETTALVDTVQTWRYSVDTRQHGFFIAKRVRKELLDMYNESEEEEDGNLHKPKEPITPTVEDIGFRWYVSSLASYENGFFDNIEPEDRFVGFADPSNYSTNPGWMLRNLLVLVRQRWHLDEVQIMCYRDTHARREHPSSLIMTLRSAEPVFKNTTPQKLSADMPTMKTSSALSPDDVDQFGELIERPKEPAEAEPAQPPPEKTVPKIPPPPKVTGWERNEHNKLVSRSVDLASYLDPARLADQAVDLNLRLIKWRISPSIDLETIKHTSCLLLGAGTLGSYVARNLMGWGVRKITFVDNARVSYSNPVRQPLYNFRDCQDGGARKAERAAEALKEIYPGANARGFSMSVPMAGHPIMDEEKVHKDFVKLKELIAEHDAIFLLMDTRESRWLPTLMGKAAGKIVINAALGFDTYVVMRHGQRQSPQQVEKAEESAVSHSDGVPSPIKTAASDPIEVPKSRKFSETHQKVTPTPSEGEELGCYFCTDVVAPANSLKAATLDQQCTVTRPGCAPLASALAVELLVSITQHRLKGRAPAPPPPPPHSGNHILAAPPTDPSLSDSHPLGTVPHTLRGYLSTWQTINIVGKSYDSCAACSPKILQHYESDDWDFVKRAINEKGYVEEVSGLAEVQRRAEEAEKAMELEEDDWDEEGEGELL